MPDRLLGKKIKTFSIVKKLGSGSFASVFQAYDDATDSIVALKVTPMSELNKSKKLRQLMSTQISVLRQCHNDNVIGFVDSFETSEFLFIVVEYCNQGDLQELLNKKGSLSEDESIFFLKQILNGFKGLHQAGAMHRDFKAANLLLHDGVLKIADLGFAKQMNQRSIATTILGTSLTMAPEVLEEKSYGYEADIWSIGVVFYQMIYGKYPYFAKNDYALIKSIKNSRPSYQGVHISANTKDFIDKCLTVDPKKRMQWVQIYKHPIIKKSQTSSLSTGVLKSKLSMNALLKFYQNTDLRETTRGLQQKSLQLKMEVLPDNSLTSLIDMKGLLTKAQVLKEEQEEYSKFDHLYIGRRNDLMFFHKFIHPYMRSFEYLRINHEIAGFILAKKAYKDLSDFLASMKDSKVIFYGQSNFNEYLKKQSYKNMMKMLEIDIETMERCCSQYKSKIKVCPLEIQNELSIKKVKSNNYEALAIQIVRQYERLLKQSIDQIKPENKIDLLRTIQALDYYKEHSKPFSHEFDRLISKADFKEIQNSIRKKNGIV